MGAPCRLAATLRGGVIDPAITSRRADPKAVTFHRFGVERSDGGWRAQVVIDV
jgi:SHS2 domain-containing protein